MRKLHADEIHQFQVEIESLKQDKQIQEDENKILHEHVEEQDQVEQQLKDENQTKTEELARVEIVIQNQQ